MEGMGGRRIQHANNEKKGEDNAEKIKKIGEGTQVNPGNAHGGVGVGIHLG